MTRYPPPADEVEVFKRLFDAQPATDNNGKLTSDELHRLLDYINRNPNKASKVISEMSKEPEPPRIVCTECPRVVDIHYAATGVFGMASNEWFMWVECHGKHFIGTLPIVVHTYDRSKKRDQYVLDDMRTWDIVTVNNHYAEAERKMVEYGERAKLLKTYMDKAGF